MSRSNFSRISIVVILIISAWYGRNLNTWGKNKVIQNDVISYYAYLPAAVIFQDLNFDFTKDLPEDFEGQIWLQQTPEGKPILRMTMGLAILWLPFFLFAHGFSHLAGISTLGYSWPYSLSIFIASLFYLGIGLIYLRKILLRYFSDGVTAITLILVILATNMHYYILSEPGMSHVYNFSLITLFIYHSFKWIERSGIGNSVLLGLLSGLIVLIRPVNILVVLFPVLIGISGFGQLIDRILKNWKWIAVIGLVAIVVWIPQMLYWKSQSGHYFFNSYMDQGRFYFLHPQIINGLFSFRKGWLIYTPLMVIALVGIMTMRKKAGEMFLPVILFMAGYTYVVYSWWCWWYGGSFGARPMIDVYGIMSIPLAASIQYVRNQKSWLKAIATVVLAGMIFLNQFQMTQYRTSLLHWDSMTKKAYWGIFLKKSWPQDYDKMIKIPDYDKALKGEKEYP